MAWQELWCATKFAWSRPGGEPQLPEASACAADCGSGHSRDRLSSQTPAATAKAMTVSQGHVLARPEDEREDRHGSDSQTTRVPASRSSGQYGGIRSDLIGF
jgi:hypothetical protein